jgi:hypothetical protein
MSNTKYQVIIDNLIQNGLDMEAADEIAFVEKYPDGKLLSFDTFSEMRDFFNQIRNDLPVHRYASDFWYDVDIQLSKDKDAFLAVVYEDWTCD